MKHAPAEQAPQQLSLLPARDELPLRFRLDERTRRRGLAHIAEIKAQLAARSARSTPTAITTAHPATRHRPAA